ncbi:MAG: aminopeptidase [Thermoleophilia bacterium]|nr:aminopeptidase [Thermoleophilia bacterium]
MRDYTELTRRLADLIVGYGAGVQPGQLVGVTSFTGKEELTREITRAAYERGAKYVDVLYWDPRVKRQRLLHGDPETFGYIPPWLHARIRQLSDEHGARISLSGPVELDAFEGVPADRMGTDALPYMPETSEIIGLRTTNWCVAPAPTRAWAAAVYPQADPEEAYSRLWDAIGHVCRLDADDPPAAWEARFAETTASAAKLTARRFDAIRLHGTGTDLTVGLLASSRWHAGGQETIDGLRYYPNIPSEETFTTPDPLRVDGYVRATMPLHLYGSIVNGIRIEFEEGRAVKIDADDNVETLRSACAKDDGGTRLGELALVDGGGRIGPLETIFFDTLLDENAASHIALGAGYLHGVESEADRQRVNSSQIHIDFMIGSPALDVDGITRDGEHVPLLRRGAWQI